MLRAAYRALAMRMHPDHNPGFVAEATERFAAIHAAYELLSDPERRGAYDQRSGGH
jgi:DnaJ-class molecular chaperone